MVCGGPAIRNMATVGGNLFAPYPFGDFAAALLALEAIVTVQSGHSGRDVPIEEEPELNDPRAGGFEGLHLDEYRVWAWATGSNTWEPCRNAVTCCSAAESATWGWLCCASTTTTSTCGT